jgi:hypothetical protein
LALWKYYRYSRTLGEAAVPFLEARGASRFVSREDALRAGAFLTYWCASIHTVSEGWKELGLQNSEIDLLISDNHIDTLRRYRNTAYHFQADLGDSRISNLAKPEPIAWVLALDAAYDAFFRHHDEAIDVERIRPWLFAPEAQASR